ncbi:MerR family transcriptional regulator [Nonomuraea sp. NPDC050310]|uniref:MerR family transcriptional regulator n=1 Tax=Nonomuraea sp. NPDC050310 TaxID=3154935 RepID=UPI0033F62837
MSETWTIGELAQRAAEALQAASPTGSGRVRDVPGERLIRWYTTIGLVDPPLTRRGRVAQYGRRHLLQLVAVKRLQAEGRSIAEIQVALAGATDATLERVAAVSRPRFWAERPAPRPTATPSPSPRPAPAPPAPAASPNGAGPAQAASGHAVHGVRLAPGVVLVLDGASRTPSEEDLQAVMSAAGPLVEVLEERRLA